MSHPVGGASTTLNPLWIPIMGEASHLKKTIEDSAEQAKQAWGRASQPFREGWSNGVKQAMDESVQHTENAAKRAGGQWEGQLRDAHGRFVNQVDQSGSKLEQSIGSVAGRVAALWEKGLDVAGEALEKVYDLGKEVIVQFLEVGETWEQVTRTLRARTTAVGQDLEGLQNTVSEIGKNTSAGFNDIAEAVGVLHQRTGLSGDALKQLATDVVDAQKVFGQPINVQQFTGAIRAYGGSMEDADKILTTLGNTARATGVPLNELIAQVHNGGPSMRQFGVEIGPASALMAQMSEGGINAQRTVFALNRAMSDAAKAGEPFQEYLRSAVERVKALYDAGDDAGAQDLAVKIFGSRGGANVATAIQENILTVDSLAQAFTDLGATGGERISDLYEKTRTLSDRFEELKHQAADSLRPFTEEVFSKVGPALQQVADWLNTHEAEAAGFVVKIGDVVGATAQGIVNITATATESLAKMFPYLADIDRFGASIADLIGQHDYADKSRTEADRLDNMSQSWTDAAGKMRGFSDAIGRQREEWRKWGLELQEGLRTQDALNTAIASTPDGKRVEIKTTAPEAKQQLDELGLNVQVLQDTDHTVVITASTADGSKKVEEWAKQIGAKNIKIVTLPNPEKPNGETWDANHPEEAFPGIEDGIPVPVVPVPSAGVSGGPQTPGSAPGGAPGAMPPLPGSAPFGAPPTGVPGVPATPPAGGPGPGMPPAPPGGAPPGAPGAPGGPPPANTTTGASQPASEMFGGWQRITKPDGTEWWIDRGNGGPTVDQQTLNPPDGWMWMSTGKGKAVLTRSGTYNPEKPPDQAPFRYTGGNVPNARPNPPAAPGQQHPGYGYDSSGGFWDNLRHWLGGADTMDRPVAPGSNNYVGPDGTVYSIEQQAYTQPMPPPSAAPSTGGRPPTNLPPDQDNPGANRLLAWQLYNQMGMPLDQWNDFERLEMSEAGYRATAKNPSSTAYGMGQFLDSTWQQYGQPATGTADPATQIQLMLTYLKNRYHGSPSEAWQFHLANNWYANGSWVSGGQGGTDDVPAWLTEGEFVVRRDSAKRWGPVLEWINTHGHSDAGFDNGGGVDGQSLWQRYISGQGIADWHSLLPPVVNDAMHGNLPSYQQLSSIGQATVSYPMAAAGNLVGPIQQELAKIPGLGGAASKGDWTHDWTHPWDIPGKSTKWWPTSYYKHAAGGFIRGYQGGGAVATDTNASRASSTSGAFTDPSNTNIVDWMKQMVEWYNQATGSTLQVTADRSGFSGNEAGDVGHPNEGGSSLHDVNRAIDIGGDAGQRAAFLKWWESDPNRVRATRQLIASHLPGLNPASTNIYGGDLFSHNGQAIAGSPGAIYDQNTVDVDHANHIHLGLEGVPVFSPGTGPSGATASMPATTGANTYQPSPYTGYVYDSQMNLVPQSSVAAYGNYGGATQSDIDAANKSVREAGERRDRAATAATDAAADLQRLQTEIDDKTGKRAATDEQIAAAQEKAAKAETERADSVTDYNAAVEKQTETLNKPPQTKQGDAKLPGASALQAFGGNLVGGLLQGLGFDDQVFSNPLDWGIWKLFTGGVNYAGGLAKNMGKSPTGIFSNAAPGQPGNNLAEIWNPPGGFSGTPMQGLLGLIPGINLPKADTHAGIPSAVTPTAQPVIGNFGAPAGPAPGPAVDASVNINYNGTVNQGLPSPQAVTQAQVQQSRAPSSPITTGGPVQ
jgi:hypothetical protein